MKMEAALKCLLMCSAFSLAPQEMLIAKHSPVNANLPNTSDYTTFIRVTKPLKRPMRALNVPENCGKWTPWVDENHPSTIFKDDKESLTHAQLEAFCPSTHGGSISKFQCKDEKGEPFFGNRTNAEETFSVSCYDMNVGVICTVIVSTWDRCPDLAVRYYCNCSPTTQDMPSQGGSSELRSTMTEHSSIMLYKQSAPVSTSHPVSDVSSSTMFAASRTPIASEPTSKSVRPMTHTLLHATSPSSRTYKGQGSAMSSSLPLFTDYPARMSTLSSAILLEQRVSSKTRSNPGYASTVMKMTTIKIAERNVITVSENSLRLQLGTWSISWWIFVLVVSGTLFVISICVSVCLYKHANTIGKRRRKVRPLQRTLDF